MLGKRSGEERGLSGLRFSMEWKLWGFDFNDDLYWISKYEMETVFISVPRLAAGVLLAAAFLVSWWLFRSAWSPFFTAGTTLILFGSLRLLTTTVLERGAYHLEPKYSWPELVQLAALGVRSRFGCKGDIVTFGVAIAYLMVMPVWLQ